jgi:hypothetical protein
MTLSYSCLPTCTLLLFAALRRLLAEAAAVLEAIHLKSVHIGGIHAPCDDLASGTKIIQSATCHGHSYRVVESKEGTVVRVDRDAVRRDLSLGAEIKRQMAVAPADIL